MDNRTRAKIDRLTRLARPFLWDLGPEYVDGSRVDDPPKDNKLIEGKNFRKKDVFQWLKSNGFEVQEKDTYEFWLNEICSPDKVEQVFKRLVIPELKRRVGAGALKELRGWWLEGMIPDRRFAKSCDRKYRTNLKRNAKAVLDIHFRFGYVHQFGPLAPIIFEDTSEWLVDEGLLKKSNS